MTTTRRWDIVGKTLLAIVIAYLFVRLIAPFFFCVIRDVINALK